MITMIFEISSNRAPGIPSTILLASESFIDSSSKIFSGISPKILPGFLPNIPPRIDLTIYPDILFEIPLESFKDSSRENYRRPYGDVSSGVTLGKSLQALLQNPDISSEIHP